MIKHYLAHTNGDAFLREASGTWFRTGDAATLTRESMVFILGRFNDRIERKSIPIMPAALEYEIDIFTGSQSFVFGTPHDVYGLEPFAIINDLGGRLQDEIKEHVENLFGKDYLRCGVMTLKQLGLDSFPLNQTGKVMKITLRDIVIRHLASSLCCRSR